MQIIARAQVGPCEDFYLHVCSAWMDDNFVPHDLYRFSYMDQFQLAIEQVIHEAIKGNPFARNEPFTFANEWH